MDDSQQVAAMQFAGGMSIARVAEVWEKDADWVQAAIRAALLQTIPERDGGMKHPRAEIRAEEAAQEAENGLAQPRLNFGLPPLRG